MKLHKSDHNGGEMNNEERIVRLETIIENINGTLGRFDKRFDSIDKRFESLDEKITSLNNRIWSNFLWVMSAFAGLFAMIAHALHWF
jgi:archaellum component FlaC